MAWSLSSSLRVPSIARTLALPAVLFALALMAVFASEVGLRLQVIMVDLVDAHGLAREAGNASIEQSLAVSIERLGAASSLAAKVAGAMGLSAIVMLLIRAFFWDIR